MTSVQFNPELTPISNYGSPSIDSGKSKESMPKRLFDKPDADRRECIQRFGEELNAKANLNMKFLCSSTGAMIGASLGLLAGPIGSVIGAALGALAGYAFAALLNTVREDAQAHLKPDVRFNQTKEKFYKELDSIMDWTRMGASQKHTGRIVECMKLLDKLTEGDDSYFDLRNCFHDFVENKLLNPEHTMTKHDYTLFKSRLTMHERALGREF